MEGEIPAIQEIVYALRRTAKSVTMARLWKSKPVHCFKALPDCALPDPGV